MPTFHGELMPRLSVGWLFVLPLASLGCAVLLLATKRGARVLPWAPAVTAVAGLVWALGHPAAASVQHVANVLRVGQLDVRCDLVLDRASGALGLVSAFLVASLASTRDARGAAGIVALGAASSFAILTDDLLVAGLAWALVALGAGASVARDRLADAFLVAGGAVLFWGLGGAFTRDGYVPSFQPRVVAVLSGEESASVARSLFDDDDDDDERLPPPIPGGAKASLTVHALPGAELYVDASRVPLGGAAHPLRSPFVDAQLVAGYHTFRVHPGQALDDFLVPQVRLEPGQRVTLLSQGPTLSSLDTRDQLALDDGSGHPRAAALASRTLFGVPLLPLSCALLALSVALRRGRGPLGALVALSGVAIFARHVHLAHGSALLVGLALAASAALATRRATLAAELALAMAGVMAGAPELAAFHVAVSALTPGLGRAHALATAPTRALLFAACWSFGGSVGTGLVLLACASSAAVLLFAKVGDAWKRPAPILAVALAAVVGSVLARSFAWPFVLCSAGLSALPFVVRRRPLPLGAPPVSARIGALTARVADGVAALDAGVLGVVVDVVGFTARGFGWAIARLDARVLEAPPASTLLRMPAPPRYAVLAVAALVVFALSFVLLTAVRS